MARSIATVRRLYAHIRGLNLWMDGPLDKGQYMTIRKGNGVYTIDIYGNDGLIETQSIWTGACNWRIYAQFTLELFAIICTLFVCRIMVDIFVLPNRKTDNRP